MTTKNFYRLSLALPILLPLPFLLACHNGNYNAVSVILTASLLIGGVPYLFVAAYLLAWTRDKTTDETRALILRSPIMMPLAMLLCAVIIALTQIGNSDSLGFIFGIWLTASLYAVGIGYAYVGVVSLGLLALKELHLVHDQD